MNFKNTTIVVKALLIASAYYLLLAILAEIHFVLNLLNNIISSEDAFTYFDYFYRLAWIILLLLVINSNYRILFKTYKKKDLVVNIIFSSIQILGFHILYLAYYCIFGPNLILLFGFQNGIETQIVFSFSEIKYALMYIESKELQFISVGFVPLIILYIYAQALRHEYVKKSKVEDNEIAPPLSEVFQNKN
jgi:hypothetical protein